MRKYLYVFSVLVILVMAGYRATRLFEEIPKTWDEEKLQSLHIPLVDTSVHVSTVSEQYYYSIPERLAYRTYPMYMPGLEPSGYYEWLAQQDEFIDFNPDKLRTEADWIKAGEIIFAMPTLLLPLDSNLKRALPGIAENWKQIKMPTTKDGIIPFFNITVKEKGQLFLGSFSCATCHTKVMPDGTTLKGAQGNYPFGKDLPLVLAYSPAAQQQVGTIPETTKSLLSMLFIAPWIKHESQKIWADFETEYDKTVIPDFQATIPGVMHRHGSMIGYPTNIPDLYNLRDRKYFDRTGLMLHRDIGDLMRYAALNQGLDFLNDYSGYNPRPRPDDPRKGELLRYSDAQLYALAKYIYSLKPPQNPNPSPAALIEKGKQIFEAENCSECHTPPLYTSNKLTPASGFIIPKEHFLKYDIYEECLETDPGLAMFTRRGSGYYKVPSLKGAWNRSAFLHSGYFATLEDMFDKKRLESDYTPTGYKPAALKTMAVTGHKYGLDLNDEDRKALIAFIKSL